MWLLKIITTFFLRKVGRQFHRQQRYLSSKDTTYTSVKSAMRRTPPDLSEKPAAVNQAEQGNDPREVYVMAKVSRQTSTRTHPLLKPLPGFPAEPEAFLAVQTAHSNTRLWSWNRAALQICWLHSLLCKFCFYGGVVSPKIYHFILKGWAAVLHPHTLRIHTALFLRYVLFCVHSLCGKQQHKGLARAHFQC